ncbi:MAG: metallophosphoesterase family protein [Gemmatimonadaceae bacterium]
MEGVDLIIHAGDVGGDDILDELALIAPVQAVYGNVDPVDDTRLEREIIRTFDGLTIHVSHGHELGMPSPERLLQRYEGDILVYGHTHRQLVTRIAGRLVINPGSAGPRRFKLLPSVARLTIENGAADARIVELGTRD